MLILVAVLSEQLLDLLFRLLLRALLLQHNQLSGSVPSQLSLLSHAMWSLCDNGFSSSDAPAWSKGQLACCGGCGYLSSQLNALVELYTTTNGSGWLDKGVWASYNSTDPCLDGWFGIGCNGLAVTYVRSLISVEMGYLCVLTCLVVSWIVGVYC